jgi:serine/threonine protein kinase
VFVLLQFGIQVDLLVRTATVVLHPDIAAMSISNQTSNTGSIQILASILNEIGASACLNVFVDDGIDDNAINTLSRFRPERISSIYGMSLDQAAAFSDATRARVRRADAAPPNDVAVHLARFDEQRESYPISTACNPTLARPFPVLPVSPADDSTIMRMLNMEMICQLGQGGFGTVYEAKNLTDRLKVALKIVKDPQNAIHAVREGQRLRRIKHKNIVLMHKVHDIDGGTCALEMEVVPGGDLSQHLEACRRSPTCRLPRDAVLRFSRQLLEALVYLHDECKWLHGDIKPQNILMQCNRVPADGSAVDYSDAEIKLADFGLTKALDHQSATSSLMLSTMVGVLKGTMLYLSPEALQGASSGGSYERAVSDDLWSACLVMLEMDTGMSIHQLMNGPGSVVIDELLTKTSPELLPLMCAVLAAPSAASRCNSAAELLRILDVSMDPLFMWQLFDAASLKYVPVHPASSVFLEAAFSANEPHTGLPLSPPLDLIFDIQALLSSPVALGYQTEKRSGEKSRIRRVLKASVLNSSRSIPAWQELVDGKAWLQCSPAMCSRLDIYAKNSNATIDAARFRHLAWESGTIGHVQLPHPLKSEPYLAPAHADDVAMLSRRVHDSLPEWDITGMQQVVNASLASNYAAYRHRVASLCNGNPNERMMFHFADPAVMTKIWQQGEGHDPRLSNWAEVGKGAYFSKHVMYGYAYKYCLWPSPPSFTVKPEPPVGESMQVFVSLVCLGIVADMGPGCETCTSPAWEAWKKELPIMPKPSRPPAMTLPADAAEKQHVLDLMQVKDVPRYHSVASTEGNLGTHPASTNTDSQGRRICNIMHPRLRAWAKEWGEQCVLFDAAASYPMFIVTLTKNRESPMGLQQLIDAGCDVNCIKALGFTAGHAKALGKPVREVMAHGWPILDLKNAGFTAQALLAGGCSAAEMKKSFFTALEMKSCGCNVQQLKAAGFSLGEVKSACFETALILSAGYSLSEMRTSGFAASDLKAAGCNAQELKLAGFSVNELQSAGFDFATLGHAQFEARALKIAGFTALQLQQSGYSVQQLYSGGYDVIELVAIGHGIKSLLSAGYNTAQLRRAGFNYNQLKDAGCKEDQLEIGGFATWNYFFWISSRCEIVNCEAKSKIRNDCCTECIAFSIGFICALLMSLMLFLISLSLDVALLVFKIPLFIYRRYLPEVEKKKFEIVVSALLANKCFLTALIVVVSSAVISLFFWFFLFRHSQY